MTLTTITAHLTAFNAAVQDYPGRFDSLTGEHLPHASVVQPAEGECVRCERSWPESDLSEDGNGDPVCVDCHAIDPGDDRAQYRAYAHH